ncbi:MAG: CAP domain-containing protein [Nitrospirota bacterium]
MKKVVCLILLVFSALLLPLEYPHPAFAEIKIEKKEVNDFRIQLLNWINQYRQDKGLNSLILDPCLNKVAQKHSEWMDATGTLSHTGKNRSSTKQRCIASGCVCDAETIFFSTDVTGQNCFESWLKSPEHKKIMSGNHTKVGIGISHGYVTAVYD